MLSVPESQLEVIVAEMAALHGDDIAGILDALTSDERAIVEGLLRDYTASFDELPAPEAETPYDTGRLSAWMRDTLSRPESALTPHAGQALLQCAVRLYPARALSPPQQAAT